MAKLFDAKTSGIATHTEQAKRFTEMMELMKTNPTIFKHDPKIFKNLTNDFASFLPQNTPPKFPRPNLVVVDDLLTHDDVADTYKYTNQQKGTSMSIFKFTTTKPSALKIWTTLIDTTISPREGYSSDQIKYRMFIMLQLAEDFKAALSHCNPIITNSKAPLVHILSVTCRMTAADESDFSDLSVLSEAFPHWVSSELYTPYYLTKQLCIKQSDDKLLFSLFDRSTLQPGETAHIVTDRGEAPGLTAYKLYNSTTPTPTMDWINISYNQNPLQVSSKDELKMHIRGELLYALESADNFIIPEGSKITIPYFVLKTDTTVPPIPKKKGADKYTPYTPETSSSTRLFVVGDRVRLRSDLIDGVVYGKMTFMASMNFSVVATIEGTNNAGNVKVEGLSFWYSPEMLEHAE